MVSYDKALEILRTPARLSPISLPVSQTCGYVAARDVASEVYIPAFSNSAMDGFAVRRADIAASSHDHPVMLRIVGSSAAGDMPSIGVGGEAGAWEIMTGAAVPEGYDCVVKIEDVAVGDHDEVIFTSAAAQKDNIRAAGEDFVPGDLIVKRGALITPFHLMALAAAGQKNLLVAPKPKIIVFSTGKEVVDDARAPLLPGQIRNSNAPYLMAALRQLPVEVRYGGVIKDIPDIFDERVMAALSDSDIIISTGAVSVGKHDFIPDSLKRLGAEVLFHRVAVRPGEPLLYACFNDGTHYFGLPGNPVSAVVGLRFYVMALLRHLQGMAAERPAHARLAAPYHKKEGMRVFCKGRLSVGASGKLEVELLQGQGSFKIKPLLDVNCWAALTEDRASFDAGDQVEVYLLSPEALC